ncbi:acyl-CoA carboxylase epsilon subunit [Streptomyces inhibens]|uniref:acyl-CoA carboxylase epsilon subunit n=1 Tax=Streptomyces inhibens TaxID=2293571 RepID=UPI0036B2CBE5
MTSSQKPQAVRKPQEYEEPKTSVAAEDRVAGAVAPNSGLPLLLRVEKGHTEPDELAAVVVALLTRAVPAGPRPIKTVPLPVAVPWNALRTFVAPHSWQTVA